MWRLTLREIAAELDYFNAERRRQNQLFAMQMSPHMKLKGERLYQALFGRKKSGDELHLHPDQKAAMEADHPDWLKERVNRSTIKKDE